MEVIICFLLAGAIIRLLFGLLESASSSSGSTQSMPHKEYVRRFVYFNPNPEAKLDKTTGEPLKWDKGDCVVRAFCGALDLPWDTVYSDLCAIGAECHDLPNSERVWKQYAKQNGFFKMKKPAMNVSEFAATHDGTYFVLQRSHAVCVKANKVHDTADSGWGRIQICYEKDDTPSGGREKVRQRRRIVKEPSAIEKEVLAELEKNGGMEISESGTFRYFNPNPESTIDETTGKPKYHASCDCVIRAFCGVLDLSWDTVYWGLCAIGKEIHDMPDSPKVITRYAKKMGLVKKTLKTSVTLSSFAQAHDGKYLIQFKLGLNPDLTCVVDNEVRDIWDQSSRKVRTYYTVRQSQK